MQKTRSENFTHVLESVSSPSIMVLHRKSASENADIHGIIVHSNEEESFLRVCISVIVVFTIIGSLMVCLVNMKNKDMLKSPYNVNLFHLAITDFLVSTAILLTPGFIFREIPSQALGGEIFCRIISSHFLTFTTATSSIYITVALATERWYAVSRPLEYRAKFHKKRLSCEIFTIWVLSLLANSLLPLEVKYNPDKNSALERCEVAKIPFVDAPIHKLLGIIQFAFKFVIPFTMNCNLYLRVLAETRKSRVLSHGIGSRHMRHNISRMAAVSTLVLAFSWLPSQVFHVCYTFDLMQLNTHAHFLTIAIALINPCLNPFIFAFHSAQYRRGFRNLFCGGYPKENADKLKQTENKRLDKFRHTQLSHRDPKTLSSSPSSPV